MSMQSKVALVCLVGALMCAPAAEGADVNVYFTAVLEAGYCGVESVSPGPGGVGTLVALPSIQAQALQSQGTAGRREFRFRFAAAAPGNCTPGNSYSIRFSGGNAQGRLDNVAADGAAGVQVQLLNDLGEVLDLADAQTPYQEVVIGNDPVEVTMYAEYVASGTVVGGPVLATATYVIQQN